MSSNLTAALIVIIAVLCVAVVVQWWTGPKAVADAIATERNAAAFQIATLDAELADARAKLEAYAEPQPEPERPKVTRTEFDQMVAARCEFCGLFHGNISCPRVAAITYRPDRSVARVEYWQTWDRSDCVVIEETVIADEGVPAKA